MRTNRWHDSFAAKAQKDGFPARSVYKLEEIQKVHRLLKKGGRVLDLGCAPGSWLLFASKIVGPQGRVIGVDLKPLSIPLPANSRFHQGDVFTFGPPWAFGDTASYDVVLSDMAPSTTGNKFVDASRSLELCETALRIGLAVLKPGGSLVCKMFHSPDFKPFSNHMKTLFWRVDHVRPKSTRKRSKEIFIVGLGKKKTAPEA